MISQEKKLQFTTRAIHSKNQNTQFQTVREKTLNYEAPLKARFEMLNKQSGEIKEQDVYLGGIPLMTEMGTFIVNGIERSHRQSDYPFYRYVFHS
jgi:DNA-directed RNA polymerase beta subunit